MALDGTMRTSLDEPRSRPAAPKEEVPPIPRAGQAINFIGELNMFCQRVLRRALAQDDVVWQETGSFNDGWTVEVHALGHAGRVGLTKGVKQKARQAAARELCQELATSEVLQRAFPLLQGDALRRLKAVLAAADASPPAGPTPAAETNWIGELNCFLQRQLRKPIAESDVIWREIGDVEEGWVVEVSALGHNGRAGPVKGPKQPVRQAAARLILESLRKDPNCVNVLAHSRPRPVTDGAAATNASAPRDE